MERAQRLLPYVLGFIFHFTNKLRDLNLAFCGWNLVLVSASGELLSLDKSRSIAEFTSSVLIYKIRTR